MAMVFPDFAAYLRYVDWILNNPSVRVLLVEGGNDQGFWRKYVHVEPLGARFKNKENNKGALIDCIRILKNKSNKLSRLVGIIDADFNNILKTRKNLPHLFYTDYHDIDTQIFVSEALIDYFSNFCRIANKVPSRSDCAKIASQCITIGAEFGLIKLALEACGYYDKNLIRSINNYLTASFNFDEKKIIAELASNLGKDFPKFDSRYKSLKNTTHDLSQLANGHDLAKILALIILGRRMSIFKKGNSVPYPKPQTISDRKYMDLMDDFFEEIECGLRGHYDFTYFEKSTLYNEIKNSTNLDFLKR